MMKQQTLFQGKLTREKDLFIPFIVAGDPDADKTVQYALRLQEAGADILELGVPYSDPLADGPVIQKAAKRALDAGMSLRKSVRMVPELRKAGVTIPIVIFTYYNPVLQYGHEAFIADLVENGVEGLLIPDLPLEESEELNVRTKEKDIELISLVAPTSDERIKRIAEQARGFLYCVSSLGVTGERKEMAPETLSFIEKVKEHSSVPVAVGFGISSNDQVRLMREHADGFIIGSKIVKLIEASLELEKNENEQAGLTFFSDELRKLVQE
ncbi:tryptophan synthase subunit alpha [Salimicrobium flavidum]|uniref:Tryptophan synthase alpha chain n=1 Tax=Salimicrobium flavidum TaxID=570947 RepID=A0A1N7JHI2_9BACI|nr:tryptophan synthase subunit alpha [Salimicrobium flavidum]SIS48758.1 tryptophan synthase, alpha chain [Salimicrobium flavidum]